eukprot:CAMPEP_0119408264 /NCGR_PEP_ID=MMETSP1335-20130426/1881_1 /TAXON_ID=259385 /ORGANISM="Chrysoculter rhomboideus, Strain RCC1486" /LENGTH=99 /DNA_ID=CAMNT_0007432487 /DNA_START=547 /DNA_END=843 /DNA_ORIENTATION=-
MSGAIKRWIQRRPRVPWGTQRAPAEVGGSRRSSIPDSTDLIPSVLSTRTQRTSLCWLRESSEPEMTSPTCPAYRAPAAPSSSALSRTSGSETPGGDIAR